MNNQESGKRVSEDELIEFFGKDFVFTDNIPEDFSARDRIIMEARRLC